MDAECIHMSNSLTSVFLSTLVLSGSALAQTDRERELIVWLSEHDQAVLGIGTVGFSITDMPWTLTGFELEKHFLLQMIEATQAQTHWELLDYTPNETLLSPKLVKFAHLMQQFTTDHVDPFRYSSWLDTSAEYAIPVGFPCCVRHQTLLHWRGCIICNDLGIVTEQQ